jgi:hypothetical protein
MARDGVALDESFDPPTPEQLRGEIAGVALAENGNPDHGPFILFRALCGADGYYCAASFRDPVGYGSGATPREAMMSLARSLRDTSDKVIAAASFRDPVGYGSGVTPREAMMSLARSLRDTSDKVIAAARLACSCDLRATDGYHVRTCPKSTRMGSEDK